MLSIVPIEVVLLPTSLVIVATLPCSVVMFASIVDESKSLDGNTPASIVEVSLSVNTRFPPEVLASVTETPSPPSVPGVPSEPVSPVSPLTLPASIVLASLSVNTKLPATVMSASDTLMPSSCKAL